MNTELPWNESDFVTAWKEWEQYRKERKLAKYVPTGLKKTLSRLKNISGNDKQTAIAIINQSIEQGYQGLFPLKPEYGTHKQPTIADRKSAGVNHLLKKGTALFAARGKQDS